MDRELTNSVRAKDALNDEGTLETGRQGNTAETPRPTDRSITNAIERGETSGSESRATHGTNAGTASTGEATDATASPMMTDGAGRGVKFLDLLWDLAHKEMAKLHLLD